MRRGVCASTVLPVSCSGLVRTAALLPSLRRPCRTALSQRGMKNDKWHVGNIQDKRVHGHVTFGQGPRQENALCTIHPALAHRYPHLYFWSAA